ncbi:MAG TPA: hypothetical protein VK536_10855 [Candidatus Limnocylindrales bacterium]|nr:hypothetical protein [Candidatus Limnocylindrales bacterium]
MSCDYFDGKLCAAIAPESIKEYKPTAREVSKFCKTDNFRECPRYKAVLERVNEDE